MEGLKTMQREALRQYLDGLLKSADFRDYCPNGLQVEGKAGVQRVICGVTASQALLDEAIERQADAILVHHGWFWKGEDGRVTGFRRQRLASLLAHDISLFAYHLPLDAHPTLGNNAQLAKRLGWTIEGNFSEQNIGFVGVPPAPTFAGELAQWVHQALGRAPLLIGDATRTIKRIAWCTGGAQSYFEEALATGADIFVSGEISEQTVHMARETGMLYLAAGHHATERYGVMALAAHLSDACSISCDFVDIDNPV
ncbi:MAG: hypothetical protein RugAbin2_00754 [Rugosibacter sp.]|jgi:dinuclear metal center YbgI/SA1388 family protein|nr:hypothetical protein [Rugosibacter sp.]